MSTSIHTNAGAASRLSAVLAYLVPVGGWLYVLIFQRKDSFAMFHLRQSIGLFLFLVGTFGLWAVVAWLVAWIPYAAVFSITLFAIVIAAYLYGVIAWVIGMVNAANNLSAPLPLFGHWASRLPIH